MEAKNPVYLDEKGRKYIIERTACSAGLGKIDKNIHVVYEDGSRAVFPEKVHKTHSKLEDDAQSHPENSLHPEELLQNLISRPRRVVVPSTDCPGWED